MLPNRPGLLRKFRIHRSQDDPAHRECLRNTGRECFFPDRSTKKGGMKMAYVIGDGCISCGSCAGACPVGAISEGDGKYEINPDTCIDCGTCAGGCPVGVISEG